MKRNVIRVATILLSVFPAVGFAQNFSADVVYLAPGPSSTKSPDPSHQPSKLYVSDNRMRLETRGLTGTILLVSSDERATVALFPEQKAYQPLASVPPQYFHVQDAENGCDDWQKVSPWKMTCEKVGHETVDGHDTVKYQNKSASLAASVSTVWIDPNLKFAVKWEGKDAGAELHNITKEEKLSSALFEVPQGYDMLKPKKKAAKGPSK